MEYPWIIVRKEGDRWVADGRARFEAGHRLPLPDGGTDGIYAGWNWDGQRLLAENDRYGVQPLFYCHHDGKLMLSPSVIQLIALGAPAELDDAAMATFARLGFFLAEDTPFRAIRALPPNAMFEFADGRLTVRGKLTIVPPQSMTEAQAVEGYLDRFRGSIRRRPPTSDHFATPLSGGRDSRHILLELCAQNHAPQQAITIRRYRPKPGDDQSQANAIATAVGVPHHTVVPSRSFTDYESQKNVLTHFCTDEMWWVIPVSEHVRGRFDCLWDGLAGDVLSAGLFLREVDHRAFEAGQLERVAEELFKEWSGSEAAVNGILHPDDQKRFTRELAMERTIQELRRHAGAASPISSFYFWNRTRREVALSPTSMYRGVERVYLPFLDHEVFNFLSSIPAAMLWPRELHTKTILQGYPDVAHVPFEDRSTQGFGLMLAPMQALWSTLGLLKLAREEAPQYRSTVRRWTWNKLRRRSSGGMPRRMIHYFIQFNAIRSKERAQSLLARYPD